MEINDDVVFVIEDESKIISRNKEIFDEVLENVFEETNNSTYDKALETPGMLGIILRRKKGKEILKQMIIDSQAPGYSSEWAREKAFKLAGYINYVYLDNSKEKLSSADFKRVLATFEISSKVVDNKDSEINKNTKKFVKMLEKK